MFDTLAVAQQLAGGGVDRDQAAAYDAEDMDKLAELARVQPQCTDERFDWWGMEING